MKNYKRLLVLTMILLTILSLGSSSVLAAESDIKVSIDGKLLSFEVPPTIIDGSTLVPVRAIFEALGAKVQWDANTKTVTGTKNGTNVRLVINSKLAYVNQKVINLEVPAKIIDGSTLVPARFIAESLGADVNWEGSSRTVLITSGQSISFADPALEAVVRSAIKKEKGDIQKVDVKSITTLDAKDKKISSLEGIQNLTSLIHLSISNNQISDLKPLASLTSLKTLYAANNKIKDISALENLTNLESLSLYTNYLNDIRAIRSLNKLTYLNIGDNFISDISVIGNLTNLDQLYMYRIQADDYSALKSLSNLTKLNIYGNAVVDLSPLKELKKLKSLYILRIDKEEELNAGLFSRYEALTNKAKSIVAAVVKPGMNEYEKELAIHDYVVNHVKYDKENFDKNTLPAESHSFIGFFEKGIAVCDGYSQAFKILLNIAGIESYIVTGDSLEGVKDNWGHAWNIVKTDGKYYHVDTTWNDSSTSGGENRLAHVYFNLSDRQILATHVFNMERYPRCINDNYQYNSRTSSNRDTVYTGDFVYTISTDRYIFKVDLKTGFGTKISNDKAQFLNLDNDLLFYSNMNDDYKIYKIKTDGTGNTKISDDYALYLKVHDHWIYYLNNQKDSDKKVFKIKQDGSSKTVITNENVTTYFDIINNQMIYRAFSFGSTGKLNTLNLSDNSRIRITEDSIPGFDHKGSYTQIYYYFGNYELFDSKFLYYINVSDGNKPYKISLNGSEKTKLSEDKCSNVELVGEWVYYKNLDDSKYYRVKNDGTQKQKVE